ncbi:MAG: trypsin-like peptidase domain-containing protein [Mariprofundaceae bacterium]
MKLLYSGMLALLLLLVSTGEYLSSGISSVHAAEPRVVAPRGALSREEQATIAIFGRASPSVVFISTTTTLLNPWTRRVFERRKGTGSGFIWDKEGHVVTNYHVIEGSDGANVRLPDGRVYKSVLIGSSPENDLAVLRINVPFDAPPPVPVGSSGDLKVGQQAYAIGNPFGLDYTLTSGVISALDRTIHEDSNREIHHLIQTDAAINPGNSGGPLLDSAGRLIGINTAIYSPSGVYAGIGFAIPVDTVNKLVPQLITYGKTIQPWLGVVTDQQISMLVLRQLGLNGVLVLKVEADSPAAEAGLRATRLNRDGALIPGDIIQAINGVTVGYRSNLAKKIAAYSIGERIQLTVLRKERLMKLSVRLAASPHH